MTSIKRDLAISSVGLGLYWCWTLSVSHGSYVSSSSGICDEGIWAVNAFAHGCAMLAFFLLTGKPKIAVRVETQHWPIFLAVLSCVGSALLSTESAAAVYGGSTIMGLSNAGIILLWAEVFMTRVGAVKLPSLIISSFLVSNGVFILEGYLPRGYAQFAPCLMPMGSIICLMSLRGAAQAKMEDGWTPFAKGGGFSVKIALYLFIFAIPINCIGRLVPDASLMRPVAFSLALAMLATLLAIEIRSVKTKTPSGLRKIISSLLCVGLILLLIPNQCLSLLSAALVVCGQSLFYAFSYARFAQIAREEKAASLRVYALGVCITDFGVTLGTLLGVVLDSEILIVSFIVVYLVLSVSFDLGRDQAVSPLGGASSAECGEGSESDESFDQKVERFAGEYALSPREAQILGLFARGKTMKGIANQESISFNTVKTHVGHIYEKCDVHTRDELISKIEEM